MPKCIAAVFDAALELLRELLQALFSQPKGRHSTSATEARRRRAKRVRRYAPMVPAAPAPLPAHPAVRRAEDGPEERPRPTPPTALRPPSIEFEADEIALVRPYYRAHETATEADRIQDRAAARLRAWGADLDHLESGPDSVFSFGPAPDGTRAYTLEEYRDPDPEPESEPSAPADRGAGHSAGLGAGPTDTFRVPGPRVAGPRVPARMNGLPHLARIRARQQQRRARSFAGVGV